MKTGNAPDSVVMGIDLHEELLAGARRLEREEILAIVDRFRDEYSASTAIGAEHKHFAADYLAEKIRDRGRQ